MITEVDNYRGWAISFNSDKETFSAYSNNFDAELTKKSFAAVKKEIDEFIKENDAFKPFWAIGNPNHYSAEKGKIKIIGIRKDFALVFENEKGEKQQISKYDEVRYMLISPESLQLKEEYARLSKIASDARKVSDEYLKSNLDKIITLKDFKKTLLQ